ncbi:sugar ABC transporter substrate-binding protein [Christensenella intestinihominis]|uniref:sugar ABC transporter substrate-binding protein n=1 Tax=Christensenella intestinihominis TaxID=1851429 RepID=UPI00082AC4F2|nr:sugar ABC transporter substrate-binding protein [Christensenella intestinihominis]
MKKVKKTLALFLTLCIAVMCFAGCSQAPVEKSNDVSAEAEKSTSPEGAATGEDKAETGGKKRVYLLYPTLEFPFVVSLMDASKNYAEEKDIELTIFDSNMDDNLQYQQAMQAIEDQVDLVILCSLSDRGVAIMRQLDEAGIPCVILNQQPAEGAEEYYTSAIVTNDYDDGVKLTELLLDQFDGKDFNIVAISGLSADSGNTGRMTGFYDTLEGHENAHVLGDQAADWEKAKAISVMENFITQYGDDIDVVYAADDTMAAGAVEALKAAGMGGGKVLVTGNSLSKEAIAYIKDGEMFATASHEPWDMAKLCFDTVDKILKGEAVEKLNYVPNPIYTKDNISEYPYGEGTW